MTPENTQSRPGKKTRAKKVGTDYIKWLGGTIRTLRNERDLSQAEFAARVGVPRSTVSKWEIGETIMSVIDIAKVSTALGVSAVRLLGLESGLPREDAHDRMMLVIKAEGDELATQILGLTASDWARLNKGYFQFAPEWLRELAKAYKVSIEWIVSGEPTDWTPPLSDGVSVRLRFLRICCGMPLPEGVTDWKAMEASEHFARANPQKVKQRIEAERAQIAMDSEASRLLSKSFPFDLDWVLTGHMGKASESATRS